MPREYGTTMNENLLISVDVEKGKVGLSLKEVGL